MTTVAIIDYGMGNLRSVAKAIEHVAPEHRIEVTSDPAVVAAADRVVFPGQGAMPDCMRELDLRGLRPAVLEAAASKPFLGICIGQQMLFENSEEGDVPGLGIFRGEVVRFRDADMVGVDGARLKVPHMGWNEVWQNSAHALWEGIPDGERFYFVHSYYVAPAEPALVAARTDYGVRFTSGVARANIFAVQFHPEKSAQAGLRLLSNFIRWTP
ncbi:imidazole glycerol phosphate synthase subunit HisH [Azoarcus sp. L1K30]|uniref:imidazole glycerol phosphate synthase subunit HisH n=1 Tax=Azoarcus sp. L1K30 TaxID=2820277 RepID=UPI001B8443D3|nr:imidazole glycerol phosphate synthase subunit HisH [Azoarcus sp. L1K30]MBR0568326.1 imidazole glycerol phosphate synthase subunit HisH [Azoarcus sp. L1K30]